MILMCVNCELELYFNQAKVNGLVAGGVARPFTIGWPG